MKKDLQHDWAVPGTRTGPIRIAGVGNNSGNSAADEVVDDDHVDGSVTRVSVSAFNAMSVADLLSTYDVLTITWNSSSSLDVDWDTRLKPFLEGGGGVLYEDPNNASDLSAILSTTSCSGSSSQNLTVTVPGLTDGVKSASDLGTSSVANNHFCATSWASWLSPFLEIPGSGTTGLYGTFGGGRMIITGPDQNFHSHATGSPTDKNQFQLLINSLKWAGRLVG